MITTVHAVPRQAAVFVRTDGIIEYIRRKGELAMLCPRGIAVYMPSKKLHINLHGGYKPHMSRDTVILQRFDQHHHFLSGGGCDDRGDVDYKVYCSTKQKDGDPVLTPNRLAIGNIAFDGTPCWNYVPANLRDAEKKWWNAQFKTGEPYGAENANSRDENALEWQEFSLSAVIGKDFISGRNVQGIVVTDDERYVNHPTVTFCDTVDGKLCMLIEGEWVEMPKPDNEFKDRYVSKHAYYRYLVDGTKCNKGHFSWENYLNINNWSGADCIVK